MSKRPLLRVHVTACPRLETRSRNITNMRPSVFAPSPSTPVCPQIIVVTRPYTETEFTRMFLLGIFSDEKASCLQPPLVFDNISPVVTK